MSSTPNIVPHEPADLSEAVDRVVESIRRGDDAEMMSLMTPVNLSSNAQLLLELSYVASDEQGSDCFLRILSLVGRLNPEQQIECIEKLLVYLVARGNKYKLQKILQLIGPISIPSQKALQMAVIWRQPVCLLLLLKHNANREGAASPNSRALFHLWIDFLTPDISLEIRMLDILKEFANVWALDQRGLTALERLEHNLPGDSVDPPSPEMRSSLGRVLIETMQPKTLMSLTRNCIYKAIGAGEKASKISSLPPLPRAIQKFLLYDELMD